MNSRDPGGEPPGPLWRESKLPSPRSRIFTSGEAGVRSRNLNLALSSPTDHQAKSLPPWGGARRRSGSRSEAGVEVVEQRGAPLQTSAVVLVAANNPPDQARHALGLGATELFVLAVD